MGTDLHHRISGLAVLAILAGLAIPVAASAAQTYPVDAEALEIVAEKIEASGGTEEDFSRACETLGAMLLRKGGVLGHGVFADFRCLAQGAPTQPAGAARVHVVLKNRPGHLDLVAIMQVPGGTAVELARVPFPHKGKPLQMLADPVFAALAAWALLDQMPFQIAVDARVAGHSAPLREFENELLEAGVTVPARLNLYAGRVRETGLIEPQHVGYLNLAGKKSAARRLHQTRAGDASLDWSAKWRAKRKAGKGPFFGLNPQGRGLAREKLVALIDAEAERLADEIEESALMQGARSVSRAVGKVAGAGYFGLRYGPALLAGDLIDQSEYFGALLELRSGYLEGVRFYYDYWPTVQGNIQGQPASFGGSRMILAYAFGLDLDSIITRIDITPKIGIWNFKTAVPIETAPGVYENPEFEVRRAPSFDIEAGLENASSVHILRGWVSRAATFLTASQKSSTQVTSTRIGMDFLVSPWGTTEPVTVSLMAFYFFESVQLRKEKSAGADEATINSLKYSQAYGGGGIAVSW